MDFVYHQQQLDEVAQDLPTNARGLFVENDLLTTVELVGSDAGLTMREIGWLCELVRQVILKERKPEEFEAGVREKLDEDNQPKAGDTTAGITKNIFLKLLPALGIAVPQAMVDAAAKYVPPPPPALVPDVTPPDKVESRVETTPPVPKTVPVPPRPAPATGAVSQIPSQSFRVASSAPASASSQLTNLKLAQLKATPPPPPNLPTGVGEVKSLHASESGAPFPRSAGGFGEASSKGRIGPDPKPTTVPPKSDINLGKSPSPLDSLMKMVAGKVSARELENHMAKLPESLRVALESVDSARKVLDIGRKHGLHIDKLGDLGTETGMVILGFTHPADFLSRLARKLELGEGAARPIAQEINTEVFLKIREALKQINNEGGIRIKEESKIPPSLGSFGGAGTNQPTRTDRSPLGTGGESEVDTKEQPRSKETRTQTSDKPEKEELNREEILEGIEHPQPTYTRVESRIGTEEKKLQGPTLYKTSETTPQTKPALPPVPLTQPPDKSDSGFRIQDSGMKNGSETMLPEIPPVILPAIAQTTDNLQPTTNPQIQKQQPPTSLPQAQPVPSIPKAEDMKPPAPAPASVSIPPVPATPPPLPEDLIGHKLANPTIAPKSEKSYNVDPYRESTE